MIKIESDSVLNDCNDCFAIIFIQILLEFNCFRIKKLLTNDTIMEYDFYKYRIRFIQNKKSRTELTYKKSVKELYFN